MQEREIHIGETARDLPETSVDQGVTAYVRAEAVLPRFVREVQHAAHYGWQHSAERTRTVGAWHRREAQVRFALSEVDRLPGFERVRPGESYLLQIPRGVAG